MAWRAGAIALGALAPSVGSGLALVRNAALLSVSLFITAAGRQANVGRGVDAAGAATLALACLVGAARSGHGSTARRTLLATPVTTLGGTTARLQALSRDGGDLALVFIDPACGPCLFVLPLLRARIGDGEPAAESDDGKHGRILVVTRGAVNDNRRLLAGLPAPRVLLDDGSLAVACGVKATPSVVMVAAGRVSSVATGTGPVVSLLAPAAFPGWTGSELGTPTPVTAVAARSPQRGHWTRREALTAAVTSVSAVVLVPLARLAPFARLAAKTSAGTGGVHCPACGSCVICEVPGPSTTELSCRPCDKKCSASQLCTGYANQFPGYRA